MGGPGSGRRKATVPGQLPDPPDYLNDYGKAKWRGMVRQNDAARILDQGYLTLLEVFCAEYGDYRANHDLRTKLREEGGSTRDLWELGKGMSLQIRNMNSLATKLGIGKADDPPPKDTMKAAMHPLA